MEELRAMQEIRVALARQEERMTQVQHEIIEIKENVDKIGNHFNELDKRTSGWKIGVLFLIGGGGILSSIYYLLTHFWTFIRGF